MIQLTETEKKSYLARKFTLLKLQKRKLPLFLPHMIFVVDIQVHMERGHDISKRQRILSKNENLTAISKKG